jgi:formyl-CoA transferase
MLPGPHLGDIGTGLSAAVGVLALLVQRLRTGQGAAVTASMQGTVATVFARLAFASQLRDGSAPLRSGFAEPGSHCAPEGTYRCAGDGMNDYCYISAASDTQWRALADAIGRPDLAHDERYRTPANRWTHRAALREEIESWTSTFDKRDVARRLTAQGITAAPVLDTAEVMNDPYLQQRHVFVPIEHPDRGHTPHVFWPVRMSDSSVPLTPAPVPGADTEAVLTAVR